MKKIIPVILLLLSVSIALPAQTKKKQSSKKETHSKVESLIQIDADNPLIKYTGRVDFSNPKAPRFAWSGVSIKAAFEGSVCKVMLTDYASGTDATGGTHSNFFNLIIDGKRIIVVKCNKEGKQIYEVNSLSDTNHTIEIFKRTEALIGEVEFKGLILASGKKLLPLPVAQTVRRMEFIGNSITCGYGNEGPDQDCKFSGTTENGYMAYGAITARNLKAEYVAVPFSGKGLTRNYDEGPHETMPQLYDRILANKPDLKWDFKKYTADVVVINLGTNDFAHSNPDSALFVQTYIKFIGTIRSNYPNASIICLTGSMMSGEALSALKRYIQAVLAELNKKGDNKVYTFNMSAQGSLGFGCDWHPNVKQHQKNAEELTGFVKGKMGW
jgi:lysophospholipase L1-like esterase